MASKRTTADKGAGTPSENTGSGHFVLPADCRIAALPSLRDELLTALGRPAVALDGRQVERADTAALQLLVLFRRELVASGGSLSWLGASHALSEAVSLLGLTQTLELPAVALA